MSITFAIGRFSLAVLENECDLLLMGSNDSIIPVLVATIKKSDETIARAKWLNRQREMVIQHSSRHQTNIANVTSAINFLINILRF